MVAQDLNPCNLTVGYLHLTTTVYCKLFINLFILFVLFLAMLGLRCCARAFPSCGEQGLLFVAVHGLLIEVASLVAEHGLYVHRLQ